MISVNKRGGFSDRNGIKTLNTEIQLTDFDERTRTALFNLIIHLYERFIVSKDIYEKIINIFLVVFWKEHILRGDKLARLMERRNFLRWCKKPY